MIVIRVVSLLKLAFATKRDDVVFNGQIEVFALHAREFSFKDNLVFVLIDIDARVPCSSANPLLAETTRKICGKEPIHLFLQGTQITKRVIANNTHDISPP